MAAVVAAKPTNASDDETSTSGLVVDYDITNGSDLSSSVTGQDKGSVELDVELDAAGGESDSIEVDTTFTTQPEDQSDLDSRSYSFSPTEFYVHSDQLEQSHPEGSGHIHTTHNASALSQVNDYQGDDPVDHLEDRLDDHPDETLSKPDLEKEVKIPEVKTDLETASERRHSLSDNPFTISHAKVIGKYDSVLESEFGDLGTLSPPEEQSPTTSATDMSTHLGKENIRGFLDKVDAFNLPSDVLENGDKGVLKESETVETLRREVFELKLKLLLNERLRIDNSEDGVNDLRKKLIDFQTECVTLKEDNNKLRRTIAEMNSAENAETQKQAKEKDDIIQDLTDQLNFYEGQCRDLRQGEEILRHQETELRHQIEEFQVSLHEELESRQQVEQDLEREHGIANELRERCHRLDDQLKSVSEDYYGRGSAKRESSVFDRHSAQTSPVLASPTYRRSGRFSDKQKMSLNTHSSLSTRSRRVHSPVSRSESSSSHVSSHDSTPFYRDRYQRLSQEYEQLQLDWERATSDADNYKSLLAESRNRHAYDLQDFEQEVAEKDQDIIRLENELRDVAAEINQLRQNLAEVEALHDENEELTEQVRLKDDEIANLAMMCNNYEIEMQNVMREIGSEQSTDDGAKQAQTDRYLALQRDLIATNETLAKKESEYRTLKREVENLQPAQEAVDRIKTIFSESETKTTELLIEHITRISGVAKETSYNSEQLEQVQGEVERLRKEVRKQETETQRAQSVSETDRQEIDRLKKERDSFESEVDLLRQSESKLQSKIDVLNEQIARHRRQLDDERKRARSEDTTELYKKHLDQAQEDYEKLSKDLAAVGKNRDELKVQIDIKARELSGEESKVLNLTRRNAELAERVESLESSQDKLRTAAEGAREVPHLKLESKSLRRQLTEEEQKVNDLRQKVESLQTSSKNLRHIYSELVTMRESTKAKDSEIKALKESLDEAREKLFSFSLSFIKQMEHILGSRWVSKVSSEVYEARRRTDDDNSLTNLFKNLDKLSREMSSGVFKVMQKAVNEKQREIDDLQKAADNNRELSLHQPMFPYPNGSQQLTDKEKWILDVLQGKNVDKNCPECGKDTCALRLHEMLRRYTALRKEKANAEEQFKVMVHQKDNEIDSLRKTLGRLKMSTSSPKKLPGR